jgi:hypothetical protein
MKKLFISILLIVFLCVQETALKSRFLGLPIYNEDYNRKPYGFWYFSIVVLSYAICSCRIQVVYFY